MSFPPAYPHDPITAIGDDVFMVRGAIQLNPIMRITRNMAVVRRARELTLINPIRLHDSELAALDQLGEVKHLLRLGAFHGVDDPFYMDRYTPQFWARPGAGAYPEPAIDQPLSEGGPLPFDNAELLAFEHTVQPESVLLLRGSPGLLLTCDAIQHYGDYSHNNLPARLLMPFIGFPRTTLVGPIWLKAMTPANGSLRSELERILTLSFDRLLAAHGTLLESGAHAAVEAAIQRAFSGD